jgi:MFS family permease
MADLTITKPEAIALENLERVDSKDSQHRNILGEDSKQLSSYWTSPRLVGSIAAAVLLANSCYIGYSLPANILTVINADIGPTPNIYLITLMYSLFMGVLHLFCARISDVVGRRYFLIGGQLFGVTGSIICAKANSINVLIAGSALAGTGGAAGLLYPVVIHELIPNRHRHWGQAGVSLSVLPSLGFGAVIARSMVANTTVGWRGVYWLNVAVSGLSAFLFLVCYFPPNFHMINSTMTKWDEVKALDYGGLALYFAGLILVILGFTWAQGIYAWQDAHVLASLIVGAVLLIAFALYEVYAPLKQPLLPVRLFKIRNITASVFIGSTMQMIWTVSLVFWPIQITALFTTDNVTIGFLSCAPGIALAAGELIFAPIFATIGHLKWQLVIASAMTAIFGAAMAAVNHERRNMGIAFTSLAGLAVGWVELITIVVTGLVAPPHDIGVAQGFLGATRAVFGTVAGKSDLTLPSFLLLTRISQ